jgi:hypothetical protein
LGPALSLQVKNVSTKNILAYSVQTLFTNPETGRGMGRHGSNTTLINTNTDKADPLLPGAMKTWAKPIEFPRNAAGGTPQYSFSVDLVVFDDGSTWGPGTAQGSQRMLQNVQLWLANHKNQE